VQDPAGSVRHKHAVSVVDVRHLRWFAAIADAGSVSEASRLLYVAQPALSRQMAALERKTGRRLLERTALTDDGRRFLIGTRKVLTAYDSLVESSDPAVRSLNGRDSGGANPGADEAVPTRLGGEADAPPAIAGLIGEFARARGNVRWRITRGHESRRQGDAPRRPSGRGDPLGATR
jgi:DNA-binding transcriptional LysR family regulator